MAGPKKRKSPRQKVTTKRPPKSAGEWKPAFLVALAKEANVLQACKAAKVSRKTAYQHKADDAAFAEAWADALEDACDELERIAHRRARKSSDTILLKLLSAHRPEKYREGLKIDLNQRGTLTIVEEILDAEPPPKNDSPAPRAE